jgi:hypothetical protein
MRSIEDFNPKSQLLETLIGHCVIHHVVIYKHYLLGISLDKLQPSQVAFIR